MWNLILSGIINIITLCNLNLSCRNVIIGLLCYISSVIFHHNRENTRKHSSRMHTFRSSGRRGGVSAQCMLGYLPGGVCPSACWDTCWRVSAPVHAGIPARGCLGYNPLPWTEFLTHACENITFPQLLLRTVIIGVDVITYCMHGCILRGFSLIHWMTDLACANFTNCFKTYLLMTALVVSVSVQQKENDRKMFWMIYDIVL